MKEPIVCICDTETTSIKPPIGICQIAAVLLVPGHGGMTIEPLFQTYCKPSYKMTKESEDVHGITEDYYTIAQSDEMAVWMLSTLLRELEKDGVVLSGYNSTKFDYPLIEALYPDPHLAGLPRLDVMNLAVRRDQGQSYKLVDVFKQEVDLQSDPRFAWILENAHDALADCWMTAAVLKKFMADRGTTNAYDLIEELKTPKRLTLMPHGKYRGERFEDIRSSYLTWAAREWTDMNKDLEYTFQQLGLR